MDTQFGTDLEASLARASYREWEEAATLIGRNVSSAERDLVKAYSFNGDSKNDPEFKSLAQRVLGNDALDDRGNLIVTPQSLQLIMGQRLNFATQAFGMLSSLLEKIDRVRQRVIDAIGR